MSKSATKTKPADSTIDDELIEVAELTLMGDLLKIVIDEIKGARDVWQKLSMGEQDEMIQRCTARLTTAVEQAVTHIAAAGRPVIECDLESVTVKDGIKAVLQINRGSPLRHDLMDAQGQAVLLVVTAIDQFSGGTDEVKPEPDQKPLALAGDDPV